MSHVVERMRCPACEASELVSNAAEAKCLRCEAVLPIEGLSILASVGDRNLSDRWAQMQEGSIERYKDEHYEEDETIAKIFGGFVSVTLKPDDWILDVGCGLFEAMPAYARDLQCAGYVGLEPLTTPVERDYPCIMGAVAEHLPFKDRSFNAILLATSLDHIEQPARALGELKRVLAIGGRLYFWVGLHEPEVLARAKTFHPIFFGRRGAKRVLRIAAGPVEYGYFLWRLAMRKRALAKGIPLDHAHFRYYTLDRLMAELSENGLDPVRSLLVPGSNSLLVEARPARLT